MFFILYGLYLSGMFFNEKGMLAGLFVSRVKPTPRSKSLVSLGQTFHLPATGPAAFPRCSTFLTLLTEAGTRWVRFSSLHPLAAATTTKLGPENEPQGLESREHGSFREETWFRIPQSIRGCMMRDERLI